MCDQTDTTSDIEAGAPPVNNDYEYKQNIGVITALLVIMSGLDLWMAFAVIAGAITDSSKEGWTVTGILSFIQFSASLLLGGLGKLWLLTIVSEHKKFEIKKLDIIILLQFLIVLFYAMLQVIAINILGNVESERGDYSSNMVWTGVQIIFFVYFVPALVARAIVNWAAKE